MKMYTQCRLKSGKTQLVCYLDSTKLKTGMRVTLKDFDDPSQWWDVVSVSETAIPRDKIKRGNVFTSIRK